MLSRSHKLAVSVVGSWKLALNSCTLAERKHDRGNVNVYLSNLETWSYPLSH